ncbi:MAG TPA: hypothetical protein VGO11_24290, partial [Chthoniobacteraceae bacterium]|nr:hypothetical protein [Chthoniobacteraceae bacterium]
RAVLDTLEAVKTEMAVAMNPNRQALQALELNAMTGGTKLCYHDTAFALWSELWQRDGDLQAAHHLAIMHHARAIDLEAGAHPGQSDADWEKALELWAGLWRADAFWTGLGERVASAPVAAKLRERLPVLLLQIHYDIAFCLDRPPVKTPVHRAKFHLQLAKKSSFPAEAKAEVQQTAFKAFTAGLPNNVWQHTERNETILQKGLACFEQFLERDPDCRTALEEALSVLVRLARACMEEINATDHEASNRSALLQKMARQAGTWRPYLDQFAAAGGLDEGQRDRLAYWYRSQGDAKSALEQYAEAQAFLEAGIRVTQPGDEERRLCEDHRVTAMACAARDDAVEGRAGAKAKCDRVRTESRLPVSACFVLANAYLLLREFDFADQLCRRGLDHDDLDESGMRPALEKMQASITKQRRR